MSAEELQERLCQAISARVDAVRYYGRLGFPVHLRPTQASGRFFFDPEHVAEICRSLRDRMPPQIEAVVARAEKICQHRFDLLGYSGLNYGAQIDWHLDAVNGRRAPFRSFHRVRYLDFDQVGDAKVTWELNRHQHLVTLAKAYRFSGNTKLTTELFDQWKHWHAQNPYPMGINWASSLEVAFRSLSWVWVYFLLADSGELPAWFRDEWVKALALSSRHIDSYLSTYFSPNTHLLGEGVALFFVGTLCPEIEEADSWKERGWQIIVQESRRQVRPDGFHFEQSLYYHVYALDFFLHARILAARNGVVIPADFDQTVENMLNALALLVGAGAPPGFGDDDGGRLFDPQRNCSAYLIDPLATGAVLFQRADLKALVGDLREETVWLLGAEAVENFDKLGSVLAPLTSEALRESGLYVMADSHSRTQLLIDAGPQGAASAGHGHADALSVCVAHSGRPLLIDPGTCIYVGNGPERNAFRGTAAHNTLLVDCCDQVIPSGPFAWANLAKTAVDCWVSGETFDLFAGHHDGYCRLADPVIHRRAVFWRKGKFWLVRDRAEGAGTHTLEIRWHLPPGYRQEGNWFTSGADSSIAVLAPEEHGWNARLEDGVWSPAYGRKEPAPVFSFRTTAALPHAFTTLLVPQLKGAQEIGILKRLEVGDADIDAYHYASATEEYYFIISDENEPWAVGPCASDAQFLCFGMHQDGHRELIFCNGRSVEIMGKPIVSGADVVQRCELLHGDTGTQMFSSAHGGIVLRESLGGLSFEKAGTTAD